MDEIWDIDRLSVYLVMDRAKIEELVANGEIPYFTIGGEIRFSKSDIGAWISGLSRLTRLQDSYRRGLEKARLELHEQAVQLLLPLVRELPVKEVDEFTLFLTLGLSLRSLGRITEAISFFYRAFNINSTDITVRRNLAEALFITGAFREALPHFKFLKDPVGAARCHYFLGEYSKAQKELESMGDRAPRAELARVYAAMGEFKKAIDEYAHVIIDGCCQGFQDSRFSQRELGRLYMRIGRYTDAARILEDSLKVYNDAETYYLLGIARLASGELEEADRALKRSLEKAPSKTSTVLAMAEVHVRRNEIQQALQSFRHALEFRSGSRLTPDGFERANLTEKESRAWQNFMNSLELDARGAGNAAVSEFRQVVAVDPDLKKIFMRIADWFEERGKDDIALEEYEKLLMRYPDDPEPHARIADLFLKKKFTESALYNYRRALSLGSNRRDIILKLCECLAGLERYEEIIELANTVKDDRITGISRYIGQAYWKMRSPVQAEKYYEMAVRENPEDYSVHVELGELYLELGKNGLAYNTFVKASELHGGDARIERGLGLAQLAENNLDRAIEHLKRATELEPDYIDAAVALEDAYYRKKIYSQAALEYNRAVLARPEDAEVHYSFAKSFMRRGELEKALGKFKLAVEINPLHKGARLGMADCLAMMGNIKEAIRTYETAISIEPQAPWVSEVQEVMERLRKRITQLPEA